MAESALPPDPSFSGIDFNPSFFSSATTEYLEFPTAQGTETFGTLYATTINTPTPSVDFNLLGSETGNINIGTSVASGKTIKIGASTLTSIHCGSIDCTGTNINNAVASGTGIVSLAPSQTTGALYIGSNSTATRTSGSINIGSNVVGLTPITIGMATKSTTALNGTVTLGSLMNTVGISDTSSISSTGLITGSSFQNTGASATISTTGAIGGSSVSVANAGYLQVGGVGAIINGINVSGNIQTASGKFLGATYDSLDATTAIALASNVTSVNVGIAGSQTSGVLNIGIGSRTTAGGIFIGTGSGATVNPITIGGAGSALTIGGTTATTGLLTTNGGLTVSGVLTAGVGILSGSITYESTGATTYTIPNTTNRDYYLLVLLASGTCVVTMPTLKANQIVHIRVYNTSGTAITVKVPTSTSGSFYPSGMSTSFATQWTAFPSGTTQNFYCTGADWVGF